MISLTAKEERDIKFCKEYTHKHNFKQLCLISHFSQHNKIDDYVVYMIQELYKQKFDIVLVSTSKNLNSIEIHKVSKYLKLMIVKNNAGYDFVSWKTALSRIPNYNNYEQIIHMNDSVFFPLYPLNKMFNQMKKEKIDFWGLGDSYNAGYYIQSFFWVFNKKMVTSSLYKTFWNDCIDLKDKGLIIKNYERAFTSLVLKQNYKVSSYIKTQNIYNDIKDRYKNILPLEEYTSFYSFWDLSISKFKSVYLKKSLLLENNLTYNIGTSIYKDLLMSYTKYDSSLISSYIKENDVKKSDSYHDFNKCIESLEMLILSLREKKRIVIYAYSYIGILLHSILKHRVTAIVDTNYESSNKKSQSYTIQNPNIINDIEYDCILVCAFGRENDVIKSLNASGIEKNIYTLTGNQSNRRKFSGNMTKLLRCIEGIDLENQKNNLSISVYKTNNILCKYLSDYNNFKGLNSLEFLGIGEYHISKRIVFQVTNKITNEVKDIEFYPT